MASSIRLRPGVKLGPYRIEALAGEGAMGRVYRALDVRLGRPVALKVLPEEFTNQRDRLSSLAQEARAASALNHPNIVTVYEVGEQSVNSITVPFIAMEFVEGKSLRELLAGGPLSERKTIEYAVQVTEALMRAHEAGIIHRDLKPDNIMIRTDGYVKVLDFGLARVASSAADASSAETYDGYFVVGTASYMSPEQARGKPIDGRSDIFSLGIVLFEALAGRPPFTGESAVDTLSGILHGEPPRLSEVAPNVSRDVARTVERCLAKEPDERFQTMRDLSLQLKSLRRDFESGLISSGARTLPEASPPPRRRWIAWAGAAVGVVVLLALFSRGKRSAPRVSVERLTTSGRAFSPAISPDGSMVAYLEEGKPRRLLLRQVGSSSALALDTPGLSPGSPAFSNDGRSIYFSADSADGVRRIYRAATLGGSPRRLVAGDRPAPSPDGRSLAFLREGAGKRPSVELCVSDADGSRDRCASAGPPPSELFTFAWKADSRSLLVAIWSAADGVTRLGLGDPETAAVHFSNAVPDRLDLQVNGLAADPDGQALFFTGSKIYGRGGDLCRKTARGVETITSGIADFRGLSIDRAGRIAATADFRENSNVYSLTLSGDPRRDTARAQILTAENEGDYRPVWSPDGKRIAFISTRTGHRSLWTMNADGNDARELTPDREDYGWPAWSPDGRFLSFSGTRGPLHGLFVEDASGGEPRPLFTSPNFIGQSSWTPDGRWLYFESTDSSGVPLLERISSGGATAELFINADLEFPTVSPDGALLAATTEPETNEQIPIRVLRLSDKAVVFESHTLASGGHLMTWTPDSRALAVILRAPGVGADNVFRLPVDGSAPARLTDFPPDWRLSGCALDSTGTRLLVTRLRNNSDIVSISPLRRPTPFERLGLFFRRSARP